MSAFGALLADTALQPVMGALPRARLVGGCVRDTLAGRAVADMDLATPDAPEVALAALESAGLRVIPTGLPHGTVTAISGGRPFEVTTLRRDEETDGRHALVAWTGSFEEDAARRDFTMNAMSVDWDGGLHDYFGGAADLAAGRVRFVGEAARRVAEDYLRSLRFFRFHARYAAGAPEVEAVRAIAGGLDGLKRLSAERVWAEIKKILCAPEPGGAVALMRELGVLGTVLPEAGDVERLRRVLRWGAPPDPVLRLAAMLSGNASGLAGRLRLSGVEAERLVAVAAAGGPVPGDGDAELRKWLAEVPTDVLMGRCWLAGGGAAWDGLRERLAAMRRPVFPLEGRHALALGASPGPGIGRALKQVRRWWLDGGCVADEAACVARLADVLIQK